MLSIYCIFTLMHHKSGLKCTNSQNRTTSVLVIVAVWSQSNKHMDKHMDKHTYDGAATVLSWTLWHCPAETSWLTQRAHSAH